MIFLTHAFGGVAGNSLALDPERICIVERQTRGETEWTRIHMHGTEVHADVKESVMAVCDGMREWRAQLSVGGDRTIAALVMQEGAWRPFPSGQLTTDKP